MKYFSDSSIEFFMALSFNNNREFFHDNHDWYMKDVREPAMRLAEDLGEAIEALNPNLERRPNRVVSRIARDTRFSNDKSPYRDHMWLSFRCEGDGERRLLPEFFFGFGIHGADCGIGYYDMKRSKSDAWRNVLITHTEECEAAVKAAYGGGFSLSGDVYKKITVPEDLPEILKSWYPVKNFWPSKNIPMSVALNDSLLDELKAAIRTLAPLYSLMSLIGDVE